MKKRIFCLCLCMCLLISAFPMTAGADNKVAFISINDTLPPELINCYTYYGGTIYAPAWIFASYGFGIYFSYNAETSTATLYNGSGQLIFDLSSGTTTDGGGNQYTLAGIMWGGNVYVPLSYIASYFGTFNYSTISTAYGTILRLKDSRVVLSDSEFVKPAANLLRQYYNQYNKNNQDNGSTTVPTPNGNTASKRVDILLSFSGFPGEGALELLERYGIKSCFFLTSEDVLSDPDFVRRLACEGHRIGVMWQGDDSLALETAEFIYEVARVPATLISSSAADKEQCSRFSDENAFIYFAPSIEALYTQEDEKNPYIVTSAVELSKDSGGISLLLGCQAWMETTLEIVLNYLNINKFDIFSPTEILFNVNNL